MCYKKKGHTNYNFKFSGSVGNVKCLSDRYSKAEGQSSRSQVNISLSVWLCCHCWSVKIEMIESSNFPCRLSVAKSIVTWNVTSRSKSRSKGFIKLSPQCAIINRRLNKLFSNLVVIMQTGNTTVNRTKFKFTKPHNTQTRNMPSLPNRWPHVLQTWFKYVLGSKLQIWSLGDPNVRFSSRLTSEVYHC